MKRANSRQKKARPDEGFSSFPAGVKMVQLVPDKYSNGILVSGTRGPTRFCFYSYSCFMGSVRGHKSELVFYPKVPTQKHISAIVHFPERENQTSKTWYKQCLCFVPSCKRQYRRQNVVVTKAGNKLFHRSGLMIYPGEKIRSYKSAVHLAPRALIPVDRDLKAQEIATERPERGSRYESSSPLWGSAV